MPTTQDSTPWDRAGHPWTSEPSEDAAALAALRRWGCDVAQGHHIARPMPARDLLSWLRARQAAVPLATAVH